MSRKADRNSFSNKAKVKKSQIRTEKIKKEVSKFVKNTTSINLDDLEDTIDNIE